MNIGTSIVVLGILTPAIMVAKRLADKDDIEFHTKKQIREQMKKEGLIAWRYLMQDKAWFEKKQEFNIEQLDFQILTWLCWYNQVCTL